MNSIRQLGHDVECSARNILSDRFDKIIWMNEYYPCAPFDFLCYKKNRLCYVDVKRCMNNKIIMSPYKLKFLLSDSSLDFQFMLLDGSMKFNMLSLKKVLKSRKYKIVLRRKFCDEKFVKRVKSRFENAKFLYDYRRKNKWVKKK